MNTFACTLSKQCMQTMHYEMSICVCCNYIHVTVQLVHHSHLGLPKNGLVDTGDLRGELMATGESIGPGEKYSSLTWSYIL